MMIESGFGLMELHAEQQRDILILRLEGRLDAHTIDRLRSRWKDYETLRHIIIDLSQTTFIDSMGLSTLVAGLKIARGRGGMFIIVDPSEAVRAIFELTAMERVFQVSADLPAALEKVASI